MSDSGNVTLDTFLGQLDDMQWCYCDDGWNRETYRKVETIIRHMWELMEAQKRALTRAMRENRIHAEALEIAMALLEKPWSENDTYRRECSLRGIKDKLAELEEQAVGGRIYPSPWTAGESNEIHVVMPKEWEAKDADKE